MAGHTGFPSLRHLHEPHPAAEMQRHCHQQGEHDLERGGGHDVGEWRWKKIRSTMGGGQPSFIPDYSTIVKSGPGMELAMNLLQALLIHMRVDLCRGDVRMAEHLLDHAEVSAIVQQMCGKGMPQQMRIDMLIEPRGFSPRFHDLTNAGRGEDGAAIGKEDEALCL